MDVGECIVPDGAYHAKRKYEHVYQRAVFCFADTYLPRLPLFPLFATRPAYDATVSDSVKCFVVVELSVAALRAQNDWGIIIALDFEGTLPDCDARTTKAI